MHSRVGNQTLVDLWVWELCCRVISSRHSLLFVRALEAKVALTGQEAPNHSSEMEPNPG